MTEANIEERSLITAFGLDNLSNITEGGDGARGHVVSDKIREQILLSQPTRQSIYIKDERTGEEFHFASTKDASRKLKMSRNTFTGALREGREIVYKGNRHKRGTQTYRVSLTPFSSNNLNGNGYTTFSKGNGDILSEFS